MLLLLLLLLIISINFLGKETFTDIWNCPNTINSCPKGCIEQKKAEYNCSKKIFYDGPNYCIKKCPYICNNKISCWKNNCCKYCDTSRVKVDCGILTSTK